MPDRQLRRHLPPHTVHFGYRSGVEVKGEGGFDFELSVDETETPTEAVAHAFTALEARAAGIRLTSLAPRFIGEFQKGIDYIGDPQAFARSLRPHVSLARELGHRLSIHSGSDKFAVFPAIGRETRSRFYTDAMRTVDEVLVAGRPVECRVGCLPTPIVSAMAVGELGLLNPIH